MFIFQNKKKIPDLPYLGAQIRCAQNRYTAVQTELKYLLNKCLYHELALLVQLYTY